MTADGDFERGPIVDVFDLRKRVIQEYADYIRSFIVIGDERIEQLVDSELRRGALWPEPLIQLNPAFEPGEGLEDLVRQGALHPECLKIFRDKPAPAEDRGLLQLHRHQVEAVHAARSGENYVLTTGTGSGKSLAYIVPIVDHVLRTGTGKGIQAIVVYPMNALANSQLGELTKFLCNGYPGGKSPVTFQRYTGQEKDEERNEIIASPPDILLTNYVMLELLLTRPKERKLVSAAKDLRFLVLDELHTYRGRQGSDVAMLVRRVRDACEATSLLHVGTSATLASGGTWEEQRAAVADTASRLFGAEVKPERVIGETLRRVTPLRRHDDPQFVADLRAEMSRSGSIPPETRESFLASPLSSWIESTLGLAEEPGTYRLVRSTPMPITGANGAAHKLAELTGLDQEKCEREIGRHLLAGYEHRDEHGRPIFAFRLHQFVSKGESVYASLEAEPERHITLQSQTYVPGSDRHKQLFPIVFCRECGQEYYLVRRCEGEDRTVYYQPRTLSDQDDEGGEPGFLHIDTEDPWPEVGASLDRLPDSWLEVENGTLRVRKVRRDRLPREVYLTASGTEGKGDLRAHYMRAPFIFCMNCKVSYSPHQQADFGKLATLGSEGRSTATTVLALSNIRRLRNDQTLEPKARKLLSFTDNRQDASLQAGHFNDFVEIALLRSALHRAVRDAGAEGLHHDTLTRRVFEALDLPLSQYAANPEVEYLQLEETQRAFRRVLGYCLYLDLRRGWRITSPNLEQCGLLDIDYLSLAALCGDEPKWRERHPVLATATPDERRNVCKVLLDFLRRELAIQADVLDSADQESILLQSNQYLIPPWALDDNEPMQTSRIAFPTSGNSEKKWNVYVSPRGGFGLFLKRPDTFRNANSAMTKTEDVSTILSDLFENLLKAGLVHRIEKRDQEAEVGYQLKSSGLVWRAGAGMSGFHDPIRVPSRPEGGHRTNRFFVDFYRADMADLKGLEAHEHTAQVQALDREEREENFRKGILPILFCSPTMELGVDIAQLNVVNMRNVPPTPANYAQRSGRAGRSGQPAFVYTYCTAGSPHDQYFFKRPGRMVAGAVSPPRLDLANEDLLRAHVHAIWLAESGFDLKSSLADILEVEGDDPTLEVLPNVRAALDDTRARERAKTRAEHCLYAAVAALVGDAKVGVWIGDVLDQLPRSFETACNRWRSLYRGALEQSKRQSKIARDASRDTRDRENAKRLRAEAEAQLNLLLERNTKTLSDFYSYRYFASEGFLPGYSFPRLPLSAYLPGKKRGRGDEEFLSRPRFLAISEFGPRAFVYHEGSRFVINKVILPVESEGGITRSAAQCKECGYVHPIGDAPGPDLCERCGLKLPPPMVNLFRMQNVSTRRRDRISSDEEERFRLGYEIKTGVRFEPRDGVPSEQTAELRSASGDGLAKLTYGHAGTIWRLNVGWRRREREEQQGYVLDVERGYWSKSQATEEDPDDPQSGRTLRVIPYVEDRRNCLLIAPEGNLTPTEMASLQAALKSAIQVEYDLEDSELAAEPLPDAKQRRAILFFEASEGGAGVLRRFVEDPRALQAVARRALEIAHFDPDTGADQGSAPGSRERCEAACYDCLLSYYNQRDHRVLDRKVLPPLLSPWMDGTVETSPSARPRDEHVERLLKLCDSELERKFVRLLDARHLKLPPDAQVHVKECNTRADFLYRAENVAIFIDGPHHDEAHQKATDKEQQAALENAGYLILRLRYDENWDAKIRDNATLFGTSYVTGGSALEYIVDSTGGFDPRDYGEEWRPLMESLTSSDGVTVEPGEEVMHEGRVVDLDLATVRKGNRSLRLVDDARSSADAVTHALSSVGCRVMRVRPNELDLTARVLAALGSE
ncbi:MAG: DEAD/DEAH box helicase [Proteobacteria bacterium]|jgi:superfamily II DNA/RNA helicase/very-short-patch-repair endonuclease|nr:DEAD/DEAH box helicase [Pseudomonadota bacterium]